LPYFLSRTRRVFPDSSVGIATRYGSGQSGDRIPMGGEIFLNCPDRPGAHPTSYTMGTGFFLGIMRPKRGVDHPPNLAPRLKKERLSRLCSIHTRHMQICCHNTDYVHINGQDRSITVILAKHCTELPDDGSLVIRNVLEQF